MHNEIELTFPNFLIVLLALGVAYWMSRAPKSVLKLMSNRYQGLGLDGDHPRLASIVRNFGRFTFFMAVNGMLLMLAPSSIAHTSGFSLVSLLLAIGISVLVLRKPKKDLFTDLNRPPHAGK